MAKDLIKCLKLLRSLKKYSIVLNIEYKCNLCMVFLARQYFTLLSECLIGYKTEKYI